jgi:hypothetical protein
MKKKLLLFLSKSNLPGNIPIASTLAWLSKSKNYIFDNYYDSYHQGIHFGGGDLRNMETGHLTGGPDSGDRHFEEFYFTLLNFDVSIISHSQSLFFSTIKNLDIKEKPKALRSPKALSVYFDPSHTLLMSWLE